MYLTSNKKKGLMEVILQKDEDKIIFPIKEVLKGNNLNNAFI